MTTDPMLPAFCGVAFKEWAGVCDAVGSGVQSLILRKGGIAEESGEFVPEHRLFWLYPTHVHQAQQGLRDGRGHPRAPGGPAGTVALQVLAEVVTIHFVDDPGRLRLIRDLHVWTGETVEARYHYKRPGLWVLGLRAYRRPEPLLIAATPDHQGCKTWVPLEPAPATAGVVPVLDDEESARRADRLRSLLNAPR